MAYRNSINRYRKWYQILLRFYPKRYRDRFGIGMEQTFNDLCRERQRAGNGLLGFVLWMYLETSTGIIREGITFMSKQKITKRLSVWAILIAVMLLIPLVLTLLGSGVDGEGFHWTPTDFVVMGGLLFGVALAYELVARRSKETVYRVAFPVGIVTALLLAWVNGAVGIIGNENQPANLLYGAVFAVGVIGSFLARFKPRGMARTLFAAAIAQMSVPVIALIIWPQISWGGAGMLGVFGLNAFFAMLLTVSALLFRRAAREQLTACAGATE
jgi:MFS family permease